MKEASIIGLDLSKRSFQAHGALADGSVAFRKKLTREKVLGFLAEQPRCTVVMEACGSAHHWGRAIHGGFKRSSQHLDGSCDEHSKTALGSFWAGALVLTRSTAGGRARGAAAILGSDCGGHGE